MFYIGRGASAVSMPIIIDFVVAGSAPPTRSRKCSADAKAGAATMSKLLASRVMCVGTEGSVDNAMAMTAPAHVSIWYRVCKIKSAHQSSSSKRKLDPTMW